MFSTTKYSHTSVSLQNILRVTAVSIAYLLLSILLVGFKTDQLVLVGLFNLLYYLNKDTRRFILGFSVFIVYWIVFDYMKIIPNYTVHTVDVAPIYHLEKTLFGISSNGQIYTPNEYFVHHSSHFLDILTGIFYLTWVPVPLAFAVFLFFKNRSEFFNFSLTFFLVNILGFIIYYIHPAAPPWYIEQYGFTFNPATPGNTAGLARFDMLTGTEIFKSIYAKSSNVFAAMPSLHSSYPVIVLFYAVRNKVGALKYVFAAVMLGIWFSAVYNSHHYVLDVIAGVICAFVGIGMYLYFKEKPSMRKWLDKMLAVTAP